jgi:glycosyltransferase involved in cell wall biosynthesis
LQLHEEGIQVRILVITDEIYPDGIGGVGKSLYNECAALARRGVSVTVFVRALNPDLPAESMIGGVRIIRFFGPQRSNPLYYLYTFTIIYQVTRWLRHYKEPYDVLYVHSAIYYIPIWLARLGRRAPIIFTYYAPLDDYIVSNIRRGKYGRLASLARIAAWVLKRVETWAFTNAEAVLPRSQFSLQSLRDTYPTAKVPHPNDLIPLSIDTSHYGSRPKLSARLEVGLTDQRAILITVRRLEGRMGLANLIEAMRSVRQRHPDVLLLIGGKGYLRPTLEKLIEANHLEEHVKLLGFVSEDDLPIYLSAADLFVLPTESLEGFGLATIEALAAGVPVVGTPIGATPEILAPIEPGLLTRDASPDALAECVTSWLDRREELVPLRTRCRAAAENLYSADQVATRLEELFNEMIEAYPGS